MTRRPLPELRPCAMIAVSDGVDHRIHVKPTMTRLFLDSLPPQTTKSAILRLLIETGGLKRPEVGRIELRGFRAEIEIPDRAARRVVEAANGAAFGARTVKAWLEPTPGTPLTSEHFRRLQALLTLEAAAEQAKAHEQRTRLGGADAERTGATLTRLALRDTCAGLGGRAIVTSHPFYRRLVDYFERIGAYRSVWEMM